MNGVSVALDETAREVSERQVLPAEGLRETIEQQRPITALCLTILLLNACNRPICMDRASLRASSLGHRRATNFGIGAHQRRNRSTVRKSGRLAPPVDGLPGVVYPAVEGRNELRIRSSRRVATKVMRSDGHAFAPSGEQVQLYYDDQRAVAVEVGGALRSYIASGRELLDGYELTERCTGARGQSLIPWPNRLRDGCYEFAGERYQLSLSEPANHNAIHGLVRWANWTVADRSEHRAVMAHVLHPQDGWPFALDLRIEYVLGDGGLTVNTTATNLGPGACPYGAGAHPYLALDTDKIDLLVLQAPGQRYLRNDDRAIPIGEEPVDGTRFDFLSPRQIGATELDTGYTDLRRDRDGVARVHLSTPGGERRVTLWQDETYPFLMLFTGDSLRQPERRRRGLGVEPMTCAPNAMRSGDGLRKLGPGESLTTGWGISPR